MPEPKMTVGELIGRLEKHDPKAIIVLSGDMEGNSHHHLYNIEETATKKILLVPAHAYLEEDYVFGDLEA